MSCRGDEIYRENTVLSPVDIYEKTVPFRAEKPSDIRAAVYAGGKLLVEYQPKEEGIPETAKPAGDPGDRKAGGGGKGSGGDHDQ